VVVTTSNEDKRKFVLQCGTQLLYCKAGSA
jgi:hypothetical protein